MEHLSNGFVFPGIDHRDAGLLQNSHNLLGLPSFKKRLHGLLQRTVVLGVGLKNLHRQSNGLIPTGIPEMELEQEFGLLAAFFEMGNLLKELGSLGEIALQ